MNSLDSFLSAIRSRLNLRRAVRAGLWAVIGAGALVLAAALVWVWRGYAVPRYWYGIGAGAAALAAVAGALLRRAGNQEAAEFADEFFQLKDSVVSRRRFAAEAKEGGYYDLQASATEAAVRPLDARGVPVPWPRALVTGAGVLVLACGLTAFKKTDPRILEKLAEEVRTQDRMEEIKEQLQKLVEELEKSTGSEEERAAIDPEELRKYVKELESTKDLAEALKQLAKLEGKLDKAAAALEQRRNEELMKKAGEELAKEEDPQARALADKLKQEKFKDAAKDLEKFKQEKDQNKKMSDRRRDSAKLKAAAKRMAAAARQQKSNRQKQNGQKNEDGSNDDKDKSAQKDQSQESDPSDELAEELEQLEMDADQHDKDMEELEEGEKLGKIDLSKLEKSDQDGEKLRLKLDKLGKDLTKMGLKKDAQSKLKMLSKKAGQSQNYLQGMAQSPFHQPGGREPGKGTWEDTRDQKDPLKDNGQTTQLKGQKGEGPSVVKVEAVDDGTGVSRRKGQGIKEGSKKQFESFVQREDVPEDVKDGVKHYFESLHAATPEEKPAEGK